MSIEEIEHRLKEVEALGEAHLKKYGYITEWEAKVLLYKAFGIELPSYICGTKYDIYGWVYIPKQVKN